ncbi:MAG: hypothetical protein E6064_08985 [Peptoniphilus harei]|nr:hypothetical protein [Peptoniphilus harei]
MYKIKKIFLIFVFLVVTIMLIYKPLMIKLTVKRYLTNNNIKNYHIVKIEKYPAQDGYLVQLKNDLNDYRNLTIISEKMPIDVIHDSRLDKEEMK